MQIYPTKDFLRKIRQTYIFFLFVTWYLNQVSMLVSWSKNDFFENHQFEDFLKMKLEKMKI